MSDAKQCDGCGKLYESNITSEVVEHDHIPFSLRAYDMVFLNNENEPVDLCGNCWIESMQKLIKVVITKEEYGYE